MLNEALAYADRGWRVFPLKPRGKKPIILEWQIKATTDAEAVRKWWERWPDANIGIALGVETGMFVLDIDGEEGSQTFNAMEAEIGALPDTLESRTGTGGRHLFFQMPEREVRNKQSFRPKLDVRGEGGYVVAPPSIHPDTGQLYEWPLEIEAPLCMAPDVLLDEICPIRQESDTTAPVSSPERPRPGPGGTPIIERASLYLQECEAAMQGTGGHDALLWAARSLIVGFELSQGEALALLWSEYNPRCSPQWDYSKASDRKDFERKVIEVARTPGQKPQGWLLDEYGLRSNDDALLAFGDRLRKSLLAGEEKKRGIAAVQIIEASPVPMLTPNLQSPKFVPFPMDCFPGKIAEFGHKLSEAHDVDESFAGLPMLVVAATAMGNAWRIKVKGEFEIPPTLWGGIVAASGQNKTGPLNAILAALRAPIPELLSEDCLLNPQGRMLYSDVTTEAVISKMDLSPRGVCVYRNELAGWLKSFNAYKKSGGDEQAWIEFWDAHEYQLDRKTNSEEVFIPAAASSIIGGIQPKVLIECFDPGKFASGLVQRMLIAHPPWRDPQWNDAAISPEEKEHWFNAITFLRSRPFESLSAHTGQYMPNVISPSPTAKHRYVAFFNETCDRMKSMDELSRAFASKARVIGARIALCIHGLTYADVKGDVNQDVSLRSMEAGCQLALWFLNEQLRVYGLAIMQHNKFELDELATKIRAEFGGVILVRRLQRGNNKKYKSGQDARADLDKLVANGYGTWTKKNEFTLKKG